MELLKKISALFRSRPAVQQLPTGSLTVNRDGSVITSTVSSAYPDALLGEISRSVMSLFREARAAQMALTEINLHYGSFNITARELRGGAVIFLLPQSVLSRTPT